MSRSREHHIHCWKLSWLVVLLGTLATASAAAQTSSDGIIPIYRDGVAIGHIDLRSAREEGLSILDLGDDWTPQLFRGGDDGRVYRPNSFEAPYRRLASADFPDDQLGERARRDQYLESHGIPPTLTLLRERFRATRDAPCRPLLDLEVLRQFAGLPIDEESPDHTDRADTVRDSQMQEILARARVMDVSELVTADLSMQDRRALADYHHVVELRRVLGVVRDRLRCDGHLRGYPTGPLDSRTRSALESFERRHRIYARGSLTGATLDALRTDPLEMERRDVIRVLTERATLTLGIIEDGSAMRDEGGTLRTFRDSEGREQPLRNLEAELRERIVRAFGLDTVDATARFLESLGELSGRRFFAIDPLALPEYYAAQMDLGVEIDRGDVFFDLPFDAEGRRIEQRLERRPTLTLFTTYRGQRIPLVQYGTTIGGWRIGQFNGRDYWEYKESPPGEVVWAEIVSTPVWLPPAGTPAESLLSEIHSEDTGEVVREINTNIVGPGYASAYGLVAAYHRHFGHRRDGSFALGVDDGIRTHGSSDYTSIWRRASHGCHRLHNHLAIRLFSFVLAHREHRRAGHRPLSFQRTVRLDGFSSEVVIDQSGYAYELARPLAVKVLEGRILGRARRALTRRIPVEEVGEAVVLQRSR